MNRRLIVLLLFVVVAFQVPTAGFAGDVVMGNWKGNWQNDGEGEGELSAQIIALGNGKYHGVFTASYGKTSSYHVPMEGNVKGDAVTFEGRVDLGSDHGGVFEWTGEVREGDFLGKYTSKKDRGRFEMKHVHLKSPTLGAKAPEGALVLLDGTSLEAWQQRDGSTPTWKLVEGAMEVAKGDVVSKRKFNDFKLHLEFRTPFMPQARGQGRGNSGVYLQARYEVQVLDSFGLEGKDNECGGIYRQHAPKQNACLPPLEWQTYDITFHALRVEGDRIVKKTRMTVVHNGITIHDDVEVDKPSAGGIEAGVSEPGGILLQDHGNPVRYRNIWVLPLEER